MKKRSFGSEKYPNMVLKGLLLPQGLKNSTVLFFARINDSQCDRICSSLTDVICLNDGYVGKQPVARKEYCKEYW